MSNKVKIVVLIVFGLLLSFFGCEKAEKKELVFRITWTDYSGRGVAIQKIVDEYNADNKKYKIILESGDENFETVEALINDDYHSIIYVLPYRYVKYFGERGLLVDLSSYFLEEKDFFYPELWKLAMVDDQVFGIPWLSHTICLIYNKTLLDQAGINPADINSLETFVDALELVVATTDAQGVGLVGADHNDISWMVNQFIYGFGSTLVDESNRIVSINNQKSIEAIAFYKDVLGPLAQSTWIDDTGVEVMNYFRNQEIAFEFQGVWGITDIEKNGNPFETGIINLETIELSPEVGPLLLAIEPSMSETDQSEAIKFIKYMISSQAQEMIMKGEYSPERDQYYPFRVPARIDLASSLIFTDNPQYLPFIEGFTNPSIDVPTAAWQIIKTELYAPGLHQVMMGTMTIEDFLQNLQTEGNRLLNP